MSPEPLDPVKAMADAITTLDEQVKTRVTSVENGRKYPEKRQAAMPAMPDGASIFETTGAWEDFSTPARDFRLLIAIDVVRGFPDHVARRPERYAMPAGKSAAGREGRIAGRARLRTCRAQILLHAQRRLAVDAVAQGRGRPRAAISRWPITPTTASNCAGARRKAARRPRPASGMRRRRSAPRCRTTAPGSANGIGRRIPGRRQQAGFGFRSTMGDLVYVWLAGIALFVGADFYFWRLLRKNLASGVKPTDVFRNPLRGGPRPVVTPALFNDGGWKIYSRISWVKNLYTIWIFIVGPLLWFIHNK